MDSSAEEAIEALRSWSAGNQLIRFKLISSSLPKTDVLKTDIGFPVSVGENGDEVSLQFGPVRVTFSLASAEDLCAVRMFDSPEEVETVIAKFPEGTLHLARFKATLDIGKILQ